MKMKYLRWMLVLIWGFEIVLYSQSVPERMNYQGRIMVDNVPFTGHTNVVLTVYDAPVGGSALYVETQTVYATEGFYSLVVGATNTVGLAAAIDSGDVYLETVIGSSIMAPREHIVSAPYAIKAGTADVAPNYLRLSGGTLTGSVTNRQRLYLYSHSNIVTTVKDVSIGKGSRAYSTQFGSVAIGTNATARYRSGGVAVGVNSDGDYNGVAFGYSADGQYSNIAIGYQSSAYSGYDRIAIGRDITNRRNRTCAIRGSLYLDGGTGLLYRSTAGVGSWIPKAFTIPHPLDPDQWVLRHFSMEGPDVWNVYAGNAVLKNGVAEVELPAYYGALNLAGSEVYDLTAVGASASLYIKQEVSGNRFVIAGDADIKVSWTIKVKRNDPGCKEGLKQYPVEQPAAEIEGHRGWFESQQFPRIVQ